MEMAKRNRLSELYSIERELIGHMEELNKKRESDKEDAALLAKLEADLESVRRRMQAIKNMPDDE